RMFEENLPQSVLQAIVQPPNIGAMLGVKAPPALTRISFFIAEDGSISARGRIDGNVPVPPEFRKADAGHVAGGAFLSGSRVAAALAREQWLGLYQSHLMPERDPQKPYVKWFMRGAQDGPKGKTIDEDCFVMANGKNFAPAWRIGAHGLRVTSDAGPFALMRV